jgi:DNA-binding beta-propeller fold protein YncE
MRYSMKKKVFPGLPEILIKALFVCCIVMYCAAPAHAIKFTEVRHLYDITFEMSQPSDVAVSGNGQIYIVDGVNNRIVVSNKRGKVLFAFGEKGPGKGQMLFPLGIFVDSTGKVYVADSGNHRIQIFDSFGEYMSEVDIPPFEGIPADPVDISVDESTGRIFIVDNNNHHILVYDLHTMKPLDTYGEPGVEKREFRYPFLMTSDRDGYLYIVDVINTRVQVLNPEGKFVQIIGGWGVEKGEFFRPKGVAVDSGNRVYVSDSYMGVIQVFKPNGDFDSVLSDPGELKVKKFNTPVGIYIDGDNRLYVVEMFAGRVGVYTLENTP